MGRPKTLRVSQQKVPRLAAAHATPPSTHSSSTGPTSHGQRASPIRPAVGDNWQSNESSYQPTLQETIPRPSDITSEITSDTSYDDVYDLYGIERSITVVTDSCLCTSIIVTPDPKMGFNCPRFSRPFQGRARRRNAPVHPFFIYCWSN